MLLNLVLQMLLSGLEWCKAGLGDGGGEATPGRVACHLPYSWASKSTPNPMLRVGKGS
jgi:hypothetical protein